MKNKAYLVKLSNGADVSIDQDEVRNLLAGVSRGSMIRVRQGLINPSFIIAVVQDKKRVGDFLEDTKYPQDAERRANGLLALKDIFDGVLSRPEERMNFNQTSSLAKIISKDDNLLT